MDTYETLKQYLEFSKHNPSTSSIIIKGRGGVGKTHMVLEALGSDCLYINGHITPKDVYNCLKENSNSNIVFDDVDSLLFNKTVLGLLKSATYPNLNNKRIVQYFSSTEKDSEQAFNFEGKIFMLCNVTPANHDFEAIKGRSLYIEFNPSNADVFKQIMSSAECDKEVIDFLFNLFGESKPFNFRHYSKAIEFKKHFPESWKELVVPLFTQKDKFSTLQELFKSKKSVKEQIDEYMKETGKTKRSYFRDKKKVTK